jgi:hypothetical protein
MFISDVPPLADSASMIRRCAIRPSRSSNDAIGNVAVMIAALGVWGSTTAWPDLFVAALMAGVFFNPSVQILRQAWLEGRKPALPSVRDNFARFARDQASEDAYGAVSADRNNPGV